MDLRNIKTRQERLSLVQTKLGLSLSAIDVCCVDKEEHVHCENYIGSITLPLGIAGPFRIQGEHANGEYFVPLATTEGALIASVSRGAKALAKNKIYTTAYKVGTTRGPVLKSDSLLHAKNIEGWVLEHMSLLSIETEKTSKHIRLMEVVVKQVGLYVFIRFSFDTDKAMGMNMVTIATHHLVSIIAQKTRSTIVSVAGNFDVDKKPAWLNGISGRGYIVQAEGRIRVTDIQSILKTTAKQIYEVWKTKCMIGSAISGSMGFNAHHANIVAAFYAATGQDLAHTVEGSIGMTLVDIEKDNTLLISVNLPAILLGTVGGGTKLKTQTEARSILKTESTQVLAEVLGAAVLAGELSLLASLAEGSLAFAHKRLGR